MGLIRLGRGGWFVFIQLERDLLHATRRAKTAREQLLQAQRAKSTGHRQRHEFEHDRQERRNPSVVMMDATHSTPMHQASPFR
ncbi:MAG: hypothetical protein ACFWT5_13890 [Pseudomonas helleri]